MNQHQKLAAVLEEMGLHTSLGGNESVKKYDRRFINDTADGGRQVRESLTITGSRGHGFIEFLFGPDGSYVTHEVYLS